MPALSCTYMCYLFSPCSDSVVCVFEDERTHLNSRICPHVLQSPDSDSDLFDSKTLLLTTVFYLFPNLGKVTRLVVYLWEVFHLCFSLFCLLAPFHLSPKEPVSFCCSQAPAHRVGTLLPLQSSRVSGYPCLHQALQAFISGQLIPVTLWKEHGQNSLHQGTIQTVIIIIMITIAGDYWAFISKALPWALGLHFLTWASEPPREADTIIIPISRRVFCLQNL